MSCLGTKNFCFLPLFLKEYLYSLKLLFSFGNMKDNKKKKKKNAGDVVLTLVLLLAVGVFCYAALICTTFTQSTKRALTNITRLHRWQ